MDVKIWQMLNGTHVLSLILRALSLSHNYEGQELFRSFHMNIDSRILFMLKFLFVDAIIILGFFNKI